MEGWAYLYAYLVYLSVYLLINDRHYIPQVVHKVASKFPINDVEFQSCFAKLTNKYIQEFAALSSKEHQDFSLHTKEFYWQVVLLMVIGKDALGNEHEYGNDKIRTTVERDNQNKNKNMEGSRG